MHAYFGGKIKPIQNDAYKKTTFYEEIDTTLWKKLNLPHLFNIF